MYDDYDPSIEEIIPFEFKMLHPMNDEEAYAHMHRSRWGGRDTVGIYPANVWFYYPPLGW